MHASNSVRYIGVMDHDIDLFEGQYIVPQGVSYNSYVILDEKIAVMDTVDADKTGEWMENLTRELAGRRPDYLIVSHLEPDHSGSLQALAKEYPGMTLVMTERARAMLPQFFAEVASPILAVREGDCLPLGSHTLRFFLAPMVHWPEVMASYEESEQILFSADGFGTFGPADGSQEWLPEARRYYINIVGKYGAQVQALLKKVATLDLAILCPLHGPVLDRDLGKYLALYDAWSAYRAEREGVVIAYTSVYGHTKEAALRLGERLREKGCAAVVLHDLARCDMTQAVADAFLYGKLVLASPTYNGDVFPFMKTFLHALTGRGYQNRTVGLIENGSWAPMAAKVMRGMLEGSKNLTILDETVKVVSALSQENAVQIDALADALLRGEKA